MIFVWGTFYRRRRLVINRMRTEYFAVCEIGLVATDFWVEWKILSAVSIDFYNISTNAFKKYACLNSGYTLLLLLLLIN